MRNISGECYFCGGNCHKDDADVEFSWDKDMYVHLSCVEESLQSEDYETQQNAIDVAKEMNELGYEFDCLTFD